METAVLPAAELDTAAAVRANAANLCAFWSGYGTVGAQAGLPEGVCGFLTGLYVPLFNGVLDTQLSAAAADRAIKHTLDVFRAAHVPLLWWVGPYSEPQDLGARLLAAGMDEQAAVPGMIVALRDLGASPLPRGITLEAVRDGAALEEWIRVAAEGSGLPQGFADAFLPVERKRGLNDPFLTRYLARLDGEPVAAAACYLAGGVAGIYAVATMPHARGMGIGAAVSAEPLRAAAAQGYEIGILQASEMGYPVYRRLGFQQHCSYRLFYMRA